MGQKETVVTNKKQIMIYDPKNDGTYVSGTAVIQRTSMGWPSLTPNRTWD
jgi:hypothetical protein